MPELTLSHSQTDDYVDYNPQNVSLATDGDRDRAPHRSNGLSSQGSVEEQEEGEYEQGSQDCKGLVHQLRQCA